MRSAREVPRLALSKSDAADSLGVSVDHLERHVLPFVRVAYVGSRRLIPVSELERFLAERAEPILRVAGTGDPMESPANRQVRASSGPVPKVAS